MLKKIKDITFEDYEAFCTSRQICTSKNCAAKRIFEYEYRGKKYESHACAIMYYMNLTNDTDTRKAIGEIEIDIPETEERT